MSTNVPDSESGTILPLSEFETFFEANYYNSQVGQILEMLQNSYISISSGD